MAAALVWLASLLGGGLALYNILVLFEDTDLSKVVTVILVQSCGFVMASLLAGLVATVTNSPAVSGLATYGALVLADIFRSASWVHGVLPTALIRPTDLLGNATLLDYVGPIATAAGLVAVFAVVLLGRPLRAPYVDLGHVTAGKAV